MGAEPVTSGSNYGLRAARLEAEEAYVAAHPKSRAAIARAAAVLPGGNTRSVLYYPPFPIVVRRSEGCRVEDIDGHVYVDFLGEYTAGLFGHSDLTIREAVERALRDGWVHGGHIEQEARFAAILCARFPALQRVRFCNSGTEANLMALTTARAVTGRPKVMVFRGAYHGGVLLFHQGDNRQNAPFPMVFGRYNDIEESLRVLETAAGELAAVIVEPMLGSGGCIPAEPAFLAALRDACDRHGILLIFDEVMTSRLAPGGLHGKLGLTPDIVTLGKYVGGGLPFGAFGGRADIIDRFDPGSSDPLMHAGTFNNNALTMAAGSAAMGEVYTPERALALNAAGNGLRARIDTLFRTRGLPMQVTGIGSMMSIHFTPEPPRTARQPGPAEVDARALLHLALLARGQQLARRGMINLSLPMGETEFDGLVAAFEDFLDSYAKVLEAALLPR